MLGNYKLDEKMEIMKTDSESINFIDTTIDSPNNQSATTSQAFLELGKFEIKMYFLNFDRCLLFFNK